MHSKSTVSKKKELRSLTGISKINFNRCPACPKGTGTVTVSLDGNFGLCRKKAAGSSIYGPLSETAMFLEQSKVDHFISHYPYQRSKSIVACNDFLAGNALRSSSRYSRLDETGVMGAACRHIHCFLSLRHGERIS